MLPGFRFLFAATVLSLSILVFGLGAAALLRAAHEEIASTPVRQAPREPVFAQPAEALQPTLALLRIDLPTAEKAPAELPAASEPSAPAPAATAPVEGEQIAALKPEEAAKPDEPAKPEVSAPQTAEAAPAPLEAAAAPAEAPAPLADVKLAAIPNAPQPANEAAPAPLAQMDAPASPETVEATTRIATLGGPAVTIENQTAAKPADAKPAADASSKRATEQRAKKHRRAAQRARLARQATVAQQPVNPFGQPTVTRRAP
jgi:hypothetical protein